MHTIREIKEHYERIALESKGHYLVGLDPQTFLEEFLPWGDLTPDAYRGILPSKERLKNLRSVVPKRGQKESVMYEPFVKALDRWVAEDALKKAQVPKAQTLRFLNTKLSDTSCNNLNPDISTYWDDDFTGRTNFSRQQTHQEFKLDLTHDPFQHVSDERPEDSECKADNMDEVQGEDDGDGDGENPEDDEREKEVEDDDEDKQDKTDEMDVNIELNDDTVDALLHSAPNEEEPQGEENIASSNEAKLPASSAASSVETDTEAGIHTRGQIAVHAGIGLTISFRKHLFSILILGRYARFIHWDRRGAIVTCRFDYTKYPLHIFNFYLRYGQLTPLQRGFDPTVELYKERLPKSVGDAIDRDPAWYGGGAMLKCGDAARSFEGFFRVEGTDDETGAQESFFIPPPKFRRACLDPFYPATRRYPYQEIAKNVKKPTMSFLKDSWQEDSEHTDREAAIYRIPKKHVKNVAFMRLGSDVRGLETETQTWVIALCSKLKRLKDKMICHRIVLDTVARDLSTFTWCKVLLSCIADAVEAAQEAYKAGILHRDLSAGTIMIVEDKETQKWRGILIDWDIYLPRKTHGRSGRTASHGSYMYLCGY
ncbi:hypothetical protein BYT27DRAFT_7259621 [Phlegmacium glaucopus]|nr:hypothetical protein BYT27DRAFT_7259621 [Phlegmacium glaucopus]